VQPDRSSRFCHRHPAVLHIPGENLRWIAPLPGDMAAWVAL
jgi:hypothetical protein